MAQAVVDLMKQQQQLGGSALQLPGVRLRFAKVTSTSPLAITFGDGVNITKKVFRSSDYTPTLNDWVALLQTDENLYFVIGKSE
jgi:hypothetical protein